MFFKKKSLFPRSPLLDRTDLPKLSFCISHKNRFDFLKQTLKQNLDDNRTDSSVVEFVLVDFGSDEDVAGWLTANFKDDLVTGYLRIFQAEGLTDWHASIAKNTVHMEARGAIWVNLDCDNYTGERGGKHIIDAFEQAETSLIYWQYSKRKLDGTFGRIGMTRDVFEQLGGYDEAFLPMGYQDGDLKDRAIALGCQLIHDRNPQFNQAIKNEKFVPKEMSWKLMNEHNEQLSRDKIKTGQLVANDGVFGLKDAVLRYDSQSGEWVSN
jgi:hypothetical protein